MPTPVQMRRRTRIQPYVSDDTHRKLRAYATAQALTESAVADAAILEFVDHHPVDEDLVLRRLDVVSQSLAQLRHDIDIVSHTLAYVARFAFYSSPTTVAPDAHRRTDEHYESLLSFVGQRLQVGARLENEVRRAIMKKAGAPASGTRKDGR
jgi:hypothetical protein